MVDHHAHVHTHTHLHTTSVMHHLIPAFRSWETSRYTQEIRKLRWSAVKSLIQLLLGSGGHRARDPLESDRRPKISSLGDVFYAMMTTHNSNTHINKHIGDLRIKIVKIGFVCNYMLVKECHKLPPK